MRKSPSLLLRKLHPAWQVIAAVVIVLLLCACFAERTMALPSDNTPAPSRYITFTFRLPGEPDILTGRLNSTNNELEFLGRSNRVPSIGPVIDRTAETRFQMYSIYERVGGCIIYDLSVSLTDYVTDPEWVFKLDVDCRREGTVMLTSSGDFRRLTFISLRFALSDESILEAQFDNKTNELRIDGQVFKPTQKRFFMVEFYSSLRYDLGSIRSGSKKLFDLEIDKSEPPAKGIFDARLFFKEAFGKGELHSITGTITPSRYTTFRFILPDGKPLEIQYDNRMGRLIIEGKAFDAPASSWFPGTLVTEITHTLDRMIVRGFLLSDFLLAKGPHEEIRSVSLWAMKGKRIEKIDGDW